MASILIVEDDRSIRKALEKFVSDLGHEVIGLSDGGAALDLLRAGGIDLCLLDMGLPVLDGTALLQALKADEGAYPQGPQSPQSQQDSKSSQGGQGAGGMAAQGDRASIVVISARDDMQSTIAAVQLGAYEYLLKPIDLDRLDLTIRRTLEQRAQSRMLAHFVAAEQETYATSQIAGRSEAIREVFKSIGGVAASRATVLVRGEAGTGKELVARAIHHASADPAQPFVVANCTAFARELLESELFGHVRGAFPGAATDKIGRMQLAGKGTLLLDEVGEIPLELQAKLLRVLQERVFERVGDARPQRLEARVIAATHRDLAAMVREGTFREDLYDRLRAVEIVLPTLHERREDLPLLIEHLLSRINRELHTSVHQIHKEAMARLLAYDWPGNVRELENVLTRAVVLARGDMLSDDLIQLGSLVAPSSERSGSGGLNGHQSRNGHGGNGGHMNHVNQTGQLGHDVHDQHAGLEHDAAPESSEAHLEGSNPGESLPIELTSLREIERRHIVRVLAFTGWNKRKSCGILKITRPTLDRKIKEFKLERPAHLVRGRRMTSDSPSV